MHMSNKSLPARTLSVAPMLDWTDRHYRHMARQITHHAWLYTEMVTTGALIHGHRGRFLDFNECEHPVALQLGGSDTSDLAQCAQIAAEWGYDEVNLNCGCPSERVQKGAFGACLMNEVDLVADGLKAMQDVVDIDVTVKHRIGVNKQEEYAVVRDFVGTIAEKAACKTFIVHARNAWLQGLSPKENREIPPLKYEYVYQLKRDFPELEIILNGGVTDNAQVAEHLQYVDGVMVGRSAYHQPLTMMAQWDALFYGDAHETMTFEALLPLLQSYAQSHLQADKGTQLRHMARHYLGLSHGTQGARQWRRMLSDATLLADNNSQLMAQAGRALNLR